MYAPLRTLTESLVPDEPLMPSSMPESHGVGPNQACGACQVPCGSSKIAFVAGSAAAAATARSFVPGIGNSASGAMDGYGPVAAPTGGFHGSEGGSGAGKA